jgi:hypothetical protein
MISSGRTIKKISRTRAATHAVPMLMLILLCVAGASASADTPADELPLVGAAAAAGGEPTIAGATGESSLNSDLMKPKLQCLSPTFPLAAGKCDGIAPSLNDLIKRPQPQTCVFCPSPAPAPAPAPFAPGSIKTTLPADGALGPGKHLIDIGYASSGQVSCTSVVTVLPCKPVAVSGTVTVPSAPGVCAGAMPLPSSVVTAATLGRGALSINAFLTVSGSVVGSGIPAPLKAAKYYVKVLYPGDITSSVSASTVSLVVSDVEAPIAAIKSTIVRDAAGFICATSTISRSSSACVAVSGAFTSVLSVSDNCPTSSLTRQYKCSSGTCPTTAISPTATKVCVPVRAGGGRVETTFTLTVTDKGGRQANLAIPIAAYHRTNVTCYSA